MCQQTLRGGLHEELDRLGHLSEAAQQERGVFYSVVADGVYLHYEHVFGHDLGREEKVRSLLLWLLPRAGLEGLNVFKWILGVRLEQEKKMNAQSIFYSK